MGVTDAAPCCAPCPVAPHVSSCTVVKGDIPQFQCVSVIEADILRKGASSLQIPSEFRHICRAGSDVGVKLFFKGTVGPKG